MDSYTIVLQSESECSVNEGDDDDYVTESDELTSSEENSLGVIQEDSKFSKRLSIISKISSTERLHNI